MINYMTYVVFDMNPATFGHVFLSGLFVIVKLFADKRAEEGTSHKALANI